MMALVKMLLAKHGYPAEATENVIAQAELPADNWAEDRLSGER